MSQRHDSHRHETTAREGWITFVLSLALWGGLLAVFLAVGHFLALRGAH